MEALRPKVELFARFEGASSNHPLCGWSVINKKRGEKNEKRTFKRG